MMGSFIRLCIRRSRAVLTIISALILGGAASYILIPKEADPDIPIPVIYIGVALPGISPQDAERLLVRPMELELQQLEGVEEMTSTSAQNYGAVILEFDVNFNKNKALEDVRAKMDLVRSQFPTEAEEPVIQEFNAALFPAIFVTLWGDAPERVIYQHARLLKDRLNSMPNVLEAKLIGQREELLEIVVDPGKLETYNISAEQLIQIVARNNRLIAAGNLDNAQSRFSVKVPGVFETARDVYELPLKVHEEGVVRLMDIADIRRSFKDRDVYARFNGKPAIAIEITKRIGANMVDTTRAVRATTADFTKDWPEPIRVSFSSDTSDFIFEMLHSLQISITNAILLVMVLVVAALGLRSALLVGTAIPTSFMIGFFILALSGYTLNMMIMFGMLLSVGILVDGAIVIVEYADRKMAEGLERKEAYAMAAQRMFFPIASSTATTLAAFLPLLLWPGVSGKFMSYLPLTVIIVLCASLATAMVFLPVLGGLVGRTEQKNSDTVQALTAESKTDVLTIRGMTGHYARFLHGALRHPIIVVAVAAVILVSVVQLFGRYNNGVEFSVDVEPEQATMFVRARGNLSPDDALAVTEQVEAFALDIAGIESVFVQAGPNLSRESGGPQGSSPRDTIGQVTMEFSDYRTRPRSRVLMEELRQRAAVLPGISLEMREQEQGPPGGKDIQLEISGPNMAILSETAAQVYEILESGRFGAVVDLEDTRPLPGIEWVLKPDRAAAGRFGADVTTIGAMVQMVTNGILVGHYRPDDSEDEIEIRARYPDQSRSIEDLDQLRVNTPSGNVPISSFVQRVALPRTDTITRVDGRRVMTVQANMALDPATGDKYPPDQAKAKIEAWLAEQQFPFGVGARLRSDEEADEASAFLGRAFIASLSLMFIILLIQFNSFYYASLTILTIGLSGVGVMLGMLVTGQTFSVIMTGTGVIALAGIVVNNSIVLIDTFIRLRDSGLAHADAVLRAAGQRLRPILLTTITTMVGLLPMALAVSVNFFDRSITVNAPMSGWWVQLATAIIFGLGFSTLLTLILIPVLVAAPTVLRNDAQRLIAFVEALAVRLPWPAALRRSWAKTGAKVWSKIQARRARRKPEGAPASSALPAALKREQDAPPSAAE